ncbi:MAG: hypothetical protein KDB00_18175 [Planctomycetales bacterium]|nr:hypothetical protein [Planctomycetales bacterium]
MNGYIQKYGPPIAVIAVALYLGWPPEAPMDLGDDLVRAKSVRWKVADLESPRSPPISNANPFEKVLVKPTASRQQNSDKATESEADKPLGPTEQDFQKGLKLGGIAQTDIHQWAIINRDVHRVGDQVPVIGMVDVYVTIRDIQDDHVTVAAGELTIILRPQERNISPVKAASATSNRFGEEKIDDKTESISQDDAPMESAAEPKRSGRDPREQTFQNAIQRETNGTSLGKG